MPKKIRINIGGFTFFTYKYYVLDLCCTDHMYIELDIEYEDHEEPVDNIQRLDKNLPLDLLEALTALYIQRHGDYPMLIKHLKSAEKEHGPGYWYCKDEWIISPLSNMDKIRTMIKEWQQIPAHKVKWIIINEEIEIPSKTIINT